LTQRPTTALRHCVRKSVLPVLSPPFGRELGGPCEQVGKSRDASVLLATKEAIMATIFIRNDSLADKVHIFIDKTEVPVKAGTEVQHSVSSGVHALLWMAKGKKDQTVKIRVRTQAGVAARVNRVLKDEDLVADATTFVA
jgi:hypothetical protein